MKQDTIMAAALQRPPEHSGKSPIFQWMWARYETYGDQLSQRGVNWEGMAKQFAVEGISDGRGNPPTAKTVRATFYKVRNVKTGQKAKRRPAKPKSQIRRTFRKSAA